MARPAAKRPASPRLKKTRRSSSPGEAPFAAAVTTDAETGWQIAVLRFDPPGEPTARRQARIADQGANLFSLTLGDQELLHQPQPLGALAEHRSGTPVLFPMPNRVRDSVFQFEGIPFAFPSNSGRNFIHGLVRDLPFRIDRVRADARGASVDFVLQWDEDQPAFALFPIRHQLTLTFTLGRLGIRIAYAVENQDRRKLPFGFALHPWFRVPGDRGQVFLRLPADKRMEAVERLPTGKLVPVSGTPFDLRRPQPLQGLELDDVYFGMTPRSRPGFRLAETGIEMTLAGSGAFTHMVVYTPADKPFFCMENQTCSTDAHNLHAQGLRRQAHLIVLGPGKTAKGHVSWQAQWKTGPRKRRSRTAPA